MYKPSLKFTDEEIGGLDGMAKFVHTQDFKALNIGFALDEGLASPDEEFVVYHGERSIWRKSCCLNNLLPPLYQ